MKLRVIFSVMAIFCIVRAGTGIANDATSFTENFKDCKEYYSLQTIELQNLKITTAREIHGWQGGKCAYKETVSTGENKYSVNCLFSPEQISNLVNTMESFENSDESKNLDLNDFEQVQNSSVAGNWSSYLQNPEICSVEMH